MSLFESRLLAEGVRAIEGESPTLSTCVDNRNGDSFESLLLERAAKHDHSLQVSTLFLHFKKITKNIAALLSLLLFVLGGLAVQNMLFSEQLTSVNFFWAFALFFVPNIILFFVWLFLFLNPILLKSSSLTKFNLMLIKLVESRFNKKTTEGNNYWELFHCYFELHFSNEIGRYQLSKLTHLLWLSYFVGAILMSIVMLATHQVDFVWQTSILSIESFQTLTQFLAYLPQQLGFPVPTTLQIQQSHLGASNIIDAENRRLVWSSLLISSLLLYGLLPRLLLFVFISKQFKQKIKNYRLDFSSLYYVQLRQLLKPNKTTLGVTDADDDDQEYLNRKGTLQNKAHQQVQLSEDYYPVAIELSDRQVCLAEKHLQQCAPNGSHSLSNVCDHQAQQQLFIELQQTESRKVGLYVALDRLPDRGVKRFIGQLTSMPRKQFQLLLIVEKAESKQRDSDWYRLAKEVGIPFENILHIEIKGDNR